MFTAIEKKESPCTKSMKNKQANMRLTISFDTSHGAPIMTSST